MSVLREPMQVVEQEKCMSQWRTEGMPTDDLLKCANCGGDPEWRDGFSTMPYIRCKSCGMRTGSSRDYEKLKRVWNRRDA